MWLWAAFGGGGNAGHGAAKLAICEAAVGGGANCGFRGSCRAEGAVAEGSGRGFLAGEGDGTIGGVTRRRPSPALNSVGPARLKRATTVTSERIWGH